MNSQDVHGLVSNAGLSNSAATVLVDNLNAIALAGCSGLDVDSLNTEDVTLVALVIDESGSMSGVRQDIITGYNQIIETFQKSKQADAILISTWSFSSSVKLHFSYTPAPAVPRLTQKDYRPDGGTTLYDAVLHVMTGMVAYGQSLRDSGVRTRCIIVVFSDGDDNQSQTTAQQVRTASQGLLAHEIYTLAYAGFGASDLRRIADEIAFPDIITAGASPSDIRRIFHQVSASVIRASQSRFAGTNSFFQP